jgi:glutamine synthetase
MSDQVDEDFLEEGFMFDGSSIAGWKSIDQSDMKLMPDTDTAYIDPFYAEKTLCLHCNVVEPDTGEPYAATRAAPREGRGLSEIDRHRRHRLFRPRGRVLRVRRRALFGEDEQGRLRDRRVDGAWNTDTEYEVGNMGHRAGVKGGYFPVNPIDHGQDMRSEMLSTMKRIGMKVDKHHHEVASNQHELGLIFGTLTEQADELQKYKYVIHNVAHAYGRSATFMPKPMKGDNGTGMHVNMSIWKDGKPLFAGDKYADLSQEALWFIGGILKHAKALNAITNPSTNSYKRLIPGFEAPVLRAYSARNRSGCVRIPWTESPKAKRVEARFPDPAANPYLCFAALLMAGIDGIKNKIDPGPGLGQGSLRPAARGTGRHPDRLRQPARGAGIAGGRPRLPAGRRRVHQGPARRLHGAEVGTPRSTPTSTRRTRSSTRCTIGGQRVAGTRRAMSGS